MNSVKLLLVVILLAAVSECRKSPYPDGIWPLDIFGNFSSSSERILSYYDFNRDRFVDMVTASYNNDRHRLNIYLWSTLYEQFLLQTFLEIDALTIRSVIASNFTNNDRVDLAVVLQEVNQTEIYTIIYEVQCSFQQCGIKSGNENLPHKMQSIPTVFQYKGSNTFLYSSQGSLKIRSLSSKDEKWQQRSFDEELFVGDEQLCPNFINSFYVDFNGDCTLDLILHCQGKHFQFLKMGSDRKFRMDKDVILTSDFEVMNIAVADIDFDGLVDLLLLGRIEGSDKLLVQMHYNIGLKSQLEPCQYKVFGNNSTFFPFHFSGHDEQINLNGFLKIQRVDLKLQSSGEGGVLRMGDINNDGFTDMIVDLQNSAYLFMNQKCLGEDCGNFNLKFIEQSTVSNIRKFTKHEIKSNPTAGSPRKQFCSLSFFDFYQDGHLDILSTLCSQVPEYGKITPILNSLNLDAFFMKITILENTINDKVKEEIMDRRLNINGAHVDLFVTSLSGERIPACGNQLSNCGFGLELPYIHIGLGRTNNYVEDLSVSISRNVEKQREMWTPIVPNSQLLIVPGKKWILKTFISPTEIMGIVFWFVVLILIVMGVVIMRLTRQEKQEDKENEESFYSILR